MIELPLQPEATELISFEEQGESFQATPETYAAWVRMKTAAEHEDVTLILVSAFRSIARQQELVEAKRKKGFRMRLFLVYSPDRDIANIIPAAP